jgi:hypothetical protein
MVYSFDRIRHWLILGATAPLPRPLRIPARFRLLTALQRSMLKNANVMIIRHPKTGGTWLRALLTRLYAKKYGLSDRRVVKADELYRQDRNLPHFLVTNGYVSWERLVADAFTGNDPVLNNKKIIFLARHPADIVVSWYIQYTRRTKAFKRELVEAEMGEHIDRENISRWEFIQHPKLGLPALIEFHNFWADALSGRDNALIVRYEDLRQETAQTLRRITDFIGESFTDEQIADAVAFGSVDNMRALERSHYFWNNSLRLRDAGNDDMLKVRRAKVGGYRGDLPPDQLQWVEKQINMRIHSVFGYGQDTTSVQEKQSMPTRASAHTEK